jgi:hypothetical protein
VRYSLAVGCVGLLCFGCEMYRWVDRDSVPDPKAIALRKYAKDIQALVTPVENNNNPNTEAVKSLFSDVKPMLRGAIGLFPKPDMAMKIEELLLEPDELVATTPPPKEAIASRVTNLKTAAEELVKVADSIPLVLNSVHEAVVKAMDRRVAIETLSAVMTAEEARRQVDGNEIRADLKPLVDNKKAEAKEGEKDFHNISLGVGPSVAFDLGGKQRIESAHLDSTGRVRIDKEQDAQLRVLFETHYFFVPSFDFLGIPADRWGFGPFIGLQSSTEDVLEAYAIGMMIGWRYKVDSRGSFNLGISAIIDPNTKVLGDNIQANQPLPDGESEVRTKEETRVGLGITVSFTF